MNIISVKDLYKTYGKYQAVNGVNFNVNKGEIFGFLGPNGAGKSTTINILCTIIGRSSGEVLLDNLDVHKYQDAVRKKIGVVFQEQTLDIRLTLRENLLIHGKIYGIDKKNIEARIDEVLKIVELEDKKNCIISSFSGGMKRRVEIARAFMHQPDVLFLDEPTTGLDPQTRAHIWDYLTYLRDTYNMTIFLTTHYMDEAEICDNIAIIDKGKIVEYGTPAELKERVCSKKVICRTLEIKELTDYIATIDGCSFTIQQNEDVVIELQNSVTTFLSNLFKNTDINISNLRICYPTLDDVFMNITGREIRD